MNRVQIGNNPKNLSALGKMGFEISSLMDIMIIFMSKIRSSK